MEWKLQILSRTTKKALDAARGMDWLEKDGWYLAGGTALALQAGHRQSIDLDFFAQKKIFPPAEVTSHFPNDTAIWDPYIVKEGTVYAKLHGAKVSFIAYPFFTPALPRHHYGLVPILDTNDIAVMKVIALSQRGRKRDFVDLYWYAKNVAPLASVIRKLPHQYAGITHNYQHIIRAFTYFADAENDPMPTLLFDATWEEIKRYFEREATKLAKELLGLE